MEGKLYCVEEKGYAEEVLKKGLSSATILCRDKDLAIRLVNVGLEDPAVLEINTDGLKNVFQEAAHDEDEVKGYMRPYTNYFSFDPIPASHIKKAELTSTNELGARVYSGMLAMKENVTSLGDMEEVAAGMRKLPGLGIETEEHIEAKIQTAMSLVRQGRFDELGDEEPEEEPDYDADEAEEGPVYVVAYEEDMEEIRKNGLVYGRDGSNFIHADEIAQEIIILGANELSRPDVPPESLKPVIMKVNMGNAEDLRTDIKARASQNVVIPVDSLKEIPMDHDGFVGRMLRADMERMMEFANAQEVVDDIEYGMKKLELMGAMTKEERETACTNKIQSMEQGMSDDDFTKAVESIGISEPSLNSER